MECVNCHYPHTQRQTWWWGTASHLVTGPPAAIGAWTTSSNLTLVTLWSTLTDEYQGYYFMPDRTRQFYYKIRSSTLNTNVLQVKGMVQGQYIGAGGYAIVYGKNLVETMQYNKADGRVEKDVRFFRPAGHNNMADGDAVTDGICEVCHTRTKYYRNDGSGTAHNAGGDCRACHNHQAGFRASCAACHGYPPVSDSLTPQAGLVWTTATGSVTAGAHDLHVNQKGIGCEACHINSTGSGATHNLNRTVSMGFSWNGSAGGTYNGQAGVLYDSSDWGTTTVSAGGLKQCSNVYCHGSTMTPNGGSRTTATWSSAGSGACGTCHGSTAANPPLLGSHRTHVMNDTWGHPPDISPVNNYIYGRNLACAVCHGSPGSGHVDGRADWLFDTATYPKLSGALYRGAASGASSPVPGAYGQCSNLYCHSVIQTATGGPLTGLPGEYKTPTWGDRLTGSCGTCHGVDQGHAWWGDLPMSTPETDTGSHRKHLENLTFTVGGGTNGPGRCGACHNYLGSDNLAGCASVCHSRNELHVDYKIDVRFAPRYGASAAYSGTAEPGDGYGNCSNTYCHSDGTSVSSGTIPPNTAPYWGATYPGCAACHGHSPSYPNGSPKANSHPEHSSKTCDNCHASTAAGWATIISNATHVNRSYDVTPASWVSFSYSYSTTGGSCSAISCHGGQGATWGVRINCNTCHGYPPVPGDGLNINAQYDGGKGVHVTSGQASNIYGMGGHIINSSELNPSYDVYGDTFTGYRECVKCHDGGTHGNGTVDVNIFTGPWSVMTPKGLYERSNGFGLGLPVYNGIPGDVNTQKTCSNIVCHQGDAPRWSCPGGE